jgi:hypothetical protein
MTSAAISYSVTGGSVQTYNFSGNLAPFTQTVVILPAYTFPAAATNTLSITVTSVNGSNDQNAVNNVLVKSIPLTTKVAATPATMEMIFKTDQYGTELTWEVKEEVSGTVVASGGPYTDLAAAGVAVQPAVAFVANPNMCYKTVINDTYGDGYNAGTGVGGYTITSGGINVYTKSTAFTTEDIALWKTGSGVGINELNSLISNISIYPSPAKNAAALSLDLIQNENVTVNVINTVGQVVFTQNLNNLSAGNHVINFNAENWASGIYNVNILTTNGTTSRKLVIAK